MKYLIYSFIIALLFSSCDDNENEEQVLVSIGSAFLMKIADNEGNDLLDPDNDNSFKIEDINNFYLIDGEKVRKFNEEMTYPKGLQLFYHGNYKRWVLLVSTNNYIDNDFKGISFLEFKNGSIDKIEVQYNDYKSNLNIINIQKIWYNDELVWNDSPNEQIIEIFK